MDYVYLAILFILSGFFMKLSDDSYDCNNNLLLATFFGVLCGLACAIASVSDVGSAYIFIAIAIGNLLAFKVDGIHHFVTFVIFAAICFTCGIPQLSIIVLLILILAALGDEVGHELIANVTENNFLNLFFEYRFLMKVVLLLLAIGGVFDIWIFVCFLLFEIFYTVAEITFDKFY